MAQALEVVPNLLGMEEREFTSSFRARFESEEVLGVLHLVETKPPRKSARRGHSILRRDASDTGDHPSTGVGDSDVSGEGSRDDMSVDDGGGDNVSGNAASEEDEGAGGYLSAVNFDVDEKGVGDNEDVADQPVASNVGASDEDANRSSPRSFERVLLRFVFDEERRPLKDAKDSIELLQATEQWIDGLIKLDDLGIIHRDISYGNLLLPSASGPTDKAGIIDFGLSHIKNPEILKQLLPENSPQDYILEDSRPHDHITGTLPFVAYELLAKFKNNKPCTHQLRHDIESVFWVLLYICLKQYEGFGGKFDDSLKALLSHNIHQVEREKRAVLGPRFLGEEEMIQGVGGSKFPDLERFLLTFVEILRDDRYRKEPGGLGPEIRELASSELSEVRKRKQQAHAASSDVPTNPKKKQKHAKAP
ncbi:hypothetical protein M407DRAFT_246874 [Tulasnella calospora MUT 4182]|uniref:Fungal-type protein kinase domain-containing protein n=1 Tax=Tulasnella calospora MUT 4182 TaxID=1051891 RepID=A0A0C3L611_9AGAM|nr:hypothetical protein M407DRAFT_246874 [Tulasnella calospora MUT 4182]